ncbi:MAG: D-sedoheptulose 7-phosphate isomerase [Candidatus Abyssubacteria bacterium]
MKPDGGGRESEASRMRTDGPALVRQRIAESIQVKQQFSEDLIQDITRVAARIGACYRKGGKMLLFGNGGSAADAQHIACELVGRFLKERRPFNAVALTTNSSIVTALGNDYGYDCVFERQVEACARPGDVVIGISTSGNSANVVRGIEAAKKIGCAAFALTGRDSGKVGAASEIVLAAPSTETPRIQESHILIGHILCELVELMVEEQDT